MNFTLPLLIALAAVFPPAAELPEQPELPDPLRMMDGTPIETAGDWREKRRPELKALFQHYVYGYIPGPTAITATVVQEDEDLFGGKAILRQVRIEFPGLPTDAPAINLALFLPAERSSPAPVILVLNKCGNHLLTAHPGMIYHEDAWYHEQCPDPAQSRGLQEEEWAIEQMIERGYAFASFHESDIDPDRDDFSDGIHPYFADNLPGPPEAHWGTVAAWAWGLMRSADYLEQDPDIDGARIIVTGHSRRGKTALFAGAMDERFALVVPHQSGTGGMALSRDNDQETVERINRVFPHWFNKNFRQFDDNEARLPVDQHLLTALVAPRPLLDMAGLRDTWANYESALLNLRAADPVYRLLGVPGLEGDGIASEEQPITGGEAGRLLQFRIDAGHEWNPQYWHAIMDFADLHLGN